MKKLRAVVPLLVVCCAFLLFSKVHQQKYYLSVCAIFRNEARFLREWIEYHRLVGVQHFYLLNNLSKDDYEAVLNPYIEKGIVELFQWPYQAASQKEWNEIQCRAYDELIKSKGYETFWLAIIDTDEFIVPIEKKNLRTFLKDYESYGGIGINWQLFGTAGVKRIPENKTLIGTLTKKAPENFHLNQFVKSIIQPRMVKKITQPHYCKFKRPFFHVTENKRLFHSHSLTPVVSVNKIRINHYTYRDEDFFYNEKSRRTKEWFPDKPDLEMNSQYNEIEDHTISSFVPELERNIFNY